MKSIAAIGCAVLAIIALVVGVMAAGTYNKLVGLDEAVTTAWSQVENVYQRRADLIPNLVATVQGAADFESETLLEVTNARSRVGEVNFENAPDAEQMAAFEQAQGSLSSALSRLLVVVENYPELRATQAFRDLQVQLEGTENRIAVERGRYNEVARSFNTARRSFPANTIAPLLGFDEEAAYFEADEGAEEAPRVEFD